MLHPTSGLAPDVFDHFYEALRHLEVEAKRVREFDRAKSTLFANISHELRTPLTLVIGPLKDLLDGKHGTLSGQASEQILLSLRNSQRLLRLVNQILDLSKLDAGRLKLNFELEDLNQLVEEAVETFSPLAGDLRIQLNFERPASPVFAPVDRDSVEKILANLLSNALKFTPAGGSISLDVQQSHPMAEMIVRDTGIGIGADDLPYIFDRYYQTNDASSRIQKGVGIGLALVKELVALHGGSIDVESCLGTGSTFTVALPLVQSGKTPTSERDHHELDVRRNRSSDQMAQWYAENVHNDRPVVTDDGFADNMDRTTVLVVEDDSDMRMLIRRALEPTFHVREAENGRTAIERVRGMLPDAIITDVMMPDMDGLALCRHLRDEPMTADIPVVFLSARAEADSQLQGMLVGADAYVTKPFEAEVLWALIGNLIAKRHRLRLSLEGTESPSKRRPVVPRSTFQVQVRSIIETHLSQPAFSVEQLAAEMAMSPSRLYRRLRDESGVSPNDLVRITRLERAAELLQDRSGTISEIAYAVGFNSLSYFGRCFRAHFAVSPSEYLALA